jgi:hypothetical protein
MTLLRDLMLADLERGLSSHNSIRTSPNSASARLRLCRVSWRGSSLVLTAETWLGPERTRSGEEAVLTIGVSQHERMAVIRRIRRTPAISFSPGEWLPADALDDAYFRLLPSGQTTVTAEEAAMLAAVFAKDGELPRWLAAATLE